MKIVAERLKTARLSKRMSQMDVMRFTGINNKTLSGYENEVSEPDLDSLTKLANAYGTTIDYLAGRVASPTDSLVEERPATPADFEGEIIGVIDAKPYITKGDSVTDNTTPYPVKISPEPHETIADLLSKALIKEGMSPATVAEIQAYIEFAKKRELEKRKEESDAEFLKRVGDAG